MHVPHSFPPRTPEHGPSGLVAPDRLEHGFSIVEALVAIAILSLVATALGQTVGFGLAANQSADDMTHATVLAADKLEELRAGDYFLLVSGGSLDDGIDGYSDAPDVNGDGNPDFLRRWQIADQPGGKLIQVWASSQLEIMGPGKQATMASLVAER